MQFLERNLVASLSGRGAVALLNLLLVPLYVHLLGVEAYGIVGLYATLLGVANLFDAGLSAGLNREVAKATANSADRAALCSMVATVERLFWLVGLILCVGFAAMAPSIGAGWFVESTLEPETLGLALSAMAVVLCLQWPQAPYNAVLFGSGRHGRVNAAQVAGLALRSTLSIGALLGFEASLPVYFATQALGMALTTLVLRIMAWRALGPEAAQAPVGLRFLRPLAGFAPAMMLLTFVTFAISHVDKIVLSRMLSLEVFGAYVVAWTAASSISVATGPSFNAFFPRFTALLAVGDMPRLRDAIDRATQYIAFLVIPAVVVGAVYPVELIGLWTGNPALAADAGPIFRWLVVGSGLNAAAVVPYAMILAHGRLRALIVQNAISGVLVVAWILWAAPTTGAVAAAWAWVAVNLGYVVVFGPLAMRGTGDEHARPWVIRAVILPSVIGAGVAVGARAGLMLVSSWPGWFGWIPPIVTGLLCSVSLLGVLPHVRAAGSVMLRRLARKP